MATTPPDFYTADPNVKLLNPERGFFYNQMPDHPDDYDDHLLLGDHMIVPHTIVPAYLYLTDECNENLKWAGVNHADTSPVLNAYAVEKLEKCRAAGVKVLFRPRYDTHDDEPAPECDVFHANTIERQENHIREVAAMLASYKDVVAFIQAGYLGKWGEWNTYGYPESTAPFLYDYPTRERIIDYVLAQYKLKQIEQDVELRRPVFAKEVLKRNDAAKVGLHMDCFLLNEHHGGTYSNFISEDGTHSPQNFPGATDPEVYANADKYAKELTANASFGGETCPHIIEDENGVKVEIRDELWRNCAPDGGTMVNETAALHMSYLNGEYATGAVDWWDDHGCLDNLLMKLGYRFEMQSVEYTKDVWAGGTFRVTFDVANTGWARLHKPRDAYLVLRNVDPRPWRGGMFSWLWQPHKFLAGPVWNWAPGTTTTISVSGSTVSFWPGTYSVRLWIPDPDLLEFLSNAPNPEDYENAKTNYAVKLATLRDGANVFDPDTGENDLGVEITVRPRRPWDRLPPLVRWPQDAARR